METHVKITYISYKIEDENEDVSVCLPDENEKAVCVSITGHRTVLVCNEHEERGYRIVKTKHGGYELKEYTLL